MTKFWMVKITTFLLWAFAAGSAVFWLLQHVNAGQAMTQTVPTSLAVPESTPAALTPKVAAALGAKNPTAQTATGALAAQQTRLQLQGVMSLANKKGAALISVDGKPAKPYRVGATIEDGLEVLSVAARSVGIGQNGVAAFTLDLPLPSASLPLKK